MNCCIDRGIFLKPVFPELVKNYLHLIKKRIFMIVFRTACHSPLLWTRSIESNTSKPIYFISILVLYPHLWLGLASGLFPSGFPTEHKHIHLLSNIRATYMSHDSGTGGTWCSWSVLDWKGLLRCSVTQRHLIGRRPEIKTFASDSSIITLLSEVRVT
jgi:hypothetical protein